LQYQFESYVLDSDRRELHRGDDVISIEPQVFDLPEYLIDNRDRVVSKDDIYATVWQGRVVSESALTTRINAARSAIGDNGEDQRLIRTFRGKGFRFIGEVQEGRPLQPNAALAGASELPSVPLALPDRPSIAVLPFVNVSGDPEQEYFADGISEDIITGLSRVRQFFVIARNSIFQYKGSSPDVRQVASALGVRYVVQQPASAQQNFVGRCRPPTHRRLWWVWRRTERMRPALEAYPNSTSPSRPIRWVRIPTGPRC